jgi:single-stranded-DNA-specific exonuclease
VPGFNLHEALAACSALLLSHGGHAAAAGLKIDDSYVEAFREAFCEYADGQLSVAQRTAELWIDGETFLSTLTLATVEQIERLAPFGQGITRPVLCASGVRLVEPPKTVGNGRHFVAAARSTRRAAPRRGVRRWRVGRRADRGLRSAELRLSAGDQSFQRSPEM